MSIRLPVRAWRLALGCRLRRGVTYVRAYRELQRERTQLLELTDGQRRDIGITRLDAVREARQPLWRELRRRVEGRADAVEEAYEAGAPSLDAMMPEHVLARGAADAPAALGLLHQLLHDAEEIGGDRAE